MNRKHRKTLNLLFARPASANVQWRDVVSLLEALGAEIDESRAGSRVGIVLSGISTLQHRPHPRPTMDKGAVADMREFLKLCGVKP